MLFTKSPLPPLSREIVERIFDKVKDDLIHTTASGFGPDRPVYISITNNNKQTTPSIATSTESILNSSTKDSSSSLESDELIDTSKVYLLGEQQIPQHVFESLKQVINDHITERIIETTTEMPSSSETETEVYATRKSSRTTPKPPKLKTTGSTSSSSARKRTTTTTTSTPRSVADKQKDDYREDDLSRPIWQQNWPPNISYLTLLRNRSQNKTHYYDDPLIKSQSSSSFNKQANQTHSAEKQHALSFTITSYLAETSTSPTPTTTQSPFRRAANRFRSSAAERNQSKKANSKQSVDLYLVHGANGQTEIHKQTEKNNDVHSSASLQSVKHVDQFEKNSLLDDTSGFVNDNFLRHVNRQINGNDNLLPNRTLIPVQGSKQGRLETLAESYQLLPSVLKQYQKSRNSINPSDLMPETTCLRAGLFQHPLDCNKFYECTFDQVLGKYVSHAFECSIKVAFDNRIVGCSSLTDPTVCIQY